MALITTALHSAISRADALVSILYKSVGDKRADFLFSYGKFAQMPWGMTLINLLGAALATDMDSVRVLDIGSGRSSTFMNLATGCAEKFEYVSVDRGLFHGEVTNLGLSSYRMSWFYRIIGPLYKYNNNYKKIHIFMCVAAYKARRMLATIHVSIFCFMRWISHCGRWSLADEPFAADKQWATLMKRTHISADVFHYTFIPALEKITVGGGKFDVLIIDVEPHGKEMRIYDAVVPFLAKDHLVILKCVGCMDMYGSSLADTFIEKMRERNCVIDTWKTSDSNLTRDVFVIV